jgi:beta-lactamase superfamily II metal-dependent hydrolase
MSELSIRFLPARQGDAIWVKWGDGHQMLVDMGTGETGRTLGKEFATLDEKSRIFELLVVTHIDADHIGGVLSGLVDASASSPETIIRDTWFNGWDHIHDRKPSELDAMGPGQGEILSGWLQSRPWNKAFGRGPVRTRARSFPEVSLPGGLKITVLGPTAKRLTELRAVWTQVVHDAYNPATIKPKSQLEPLGAKEPPVIASSEDLEKLAASNLGSDSSAANGTSICLLLEYFGKRVLLTGDGFADDIAEALCALRVKRKDLVDPSSGTIGLDLVKVPHHGSQNNLTRELVQSVSCPTWVFSSDGTRYMHPDAPTIARLIKWGTVSPTLIFTETTAFNAYWQRKEWQSEFGYDTLYGTRPTGITWPLSVP